MSVHQRHYGSMPDGQSIEEYILRNGSGIEARIITYGGIITSLRVPDRHGQFASVVLGFASLADYLKPHPYLGAITGRFANRIARGRFTLDGIEYALATNNGQNALHGGLRGFDKQIWSARASEDSLELNYLSPQGEEGYPGSLDVTVTYKLTDLNGLEIRYQATTDAPTIINLTNHSYFNLAGEGSGSIEDHLLMINAESFIPIDAQQIPTGDIVSVEGTPFDFRVTKPVGADLRSAHSQMLHGSGYDHNYVLSGDEQRAAARLHDPVSGRVMEVYTSEPGMQLYTGNFLDGKLVGASGKAYRQSDALCLETQHYPDSPNQPSFPSTVLRPGEVYSSSTTYVFSVE